MPATVTPADSAGVCTGQCCVAPIFSVAADHLAEGCEDPEHRYLADMLTPISVSEARIREELVGFMPREWDEAAEPNICRHFDTGTRRCTAYESRPSGCRDWPLPDAGCLFCGYRPFPVWPWFRD